MSAASDHTLHLTELSATRRRAADYGVHTYISDDMCLVVDHRRHPELPPHLTVRFEPAESLMDTVCYSTMASNRSVDEWRRARDEAVRFERLYASRLLHAWSQMRYGSRVNPHDPAADLTLIERILVARGRAYHLSFALNEVRKKSGTAAFPPGCAAERDRDGLIALAERCEAEMARQSAAA